MNEKDSDLLLRSWLYLNDNKGNLTEGEEKNLKIILNGVKELDKQGREILMRKYLSRIGDRLKTEKEIADEANLKERTVKRRLSNAINQFSKVAKSFKDTGFYEINYRDIPTNLNDDRISVLMARCKESELEILKCRMIKKMTNKETGIVVGKHFNHVGVVSKRLKDQLEEINLDDLVDKEVVKEDLFYYSSMKRELHVLNKLTKKYPGNESIKLRIEQLENKILMTERYINIYKNIEPYYFMAIKMKYFGDIPLEKSYLKLGVSVTLLIKHHSDFKKRYKQRLNEKRAIYSEV